MNFDVVIGNPPYQMTGGAGGSSDSSIYHLFVEQALALEPRFLSMVVPSRWMAGGRGLDEFRKTMLASQHLRELVDWNDSGEAFPGVQIKGGICYFLWEADYQGKCSVTRVSAGVWHRQKPRDLGEFDVLVRDEKALSVLRKVIPKMKEPVSDLVSGDTPFGIATNFQDFTTSRGRDDLELHRINRGKRTVSYIKRSLIRKNVSAIDVWKVFLPKAYGAGESYPHQILGQAIVAGPGSVSTQTYVMASPFTSETEANSFAAYYRTRFVRFLVSLRKITQDAPRDVYSWVPQQTWDREWSDEILYEHYGITDEERQYIESMIRPMEPKDGGD
jgi:site-specific DNA-methyltransferase (adenine-specific)